MPGGKGHVKISHLREEDCNQQNPDWETHRTVSSTNKLEGG